MSDWKNRLGVMYSTNPDFQYEHEDSEEVAETLPPEKQRLRITLDRKQRRGKEVTLVSGYVGSADDLTDLSRLLKQRCGVGGAARRRNNHPRQSGRKGERDTTKFALWCEVVIRYSLFHSTSVYSSSFFSALSPRRQSQAFAG